MDQQQLPMNPRLDASVLPEQQASDWAKSTESALENTKPPLTTESASVPGETSRVVQPEDSLLDTSAKPQSHIDNTFGTSSAVSTPGVQLPGAWTEKPSTATQMLNDAGNALASVGSAAYNALPDSIKETLSPQSTTKSPIQTTTNYETTSPTQNLSETAQSTLSKIAEASAAAGTTVAAGATAAYEKVAGPDTAGIDKTKERMPPQQTATLPSQDVFGQPPHSGVQDGVGALPGHRDETGVAILPDDKDALANKSSMSTEPTTGPQMTYTDQAKLAAAGMAATATAAAASLTSTAKDAYANPSDYVPGMPKPLGNDGNTMPYHQTQTLPSQDTQGQLPYSGPMDGVGALPGTVSEEGVAVLPEEMINPNPLAAKKNTTLAEPYNSESPYSNTDANAVQQPSGAKNILSTGAGPTSSGGVKEKAEEVKDKITPNKSSSADSTSSGGSDNNGGSPTSPSKKPSLMSKIKGEAKVLTGKLSKNQEKVAEGQALKSGTNA